MPCVIIIVQVDNKVNQMYGEYMRKYIYLFGIIYSFLTFMVGWNHMQDNGFETFNVGMMAFTPTIAFVLGLDWARQMDLRGEEDS